MKCDKCQMLGDAAPCDECYREGLKTGEKASKAWFEFEIHCKKVGIVASAYTAFQCGYNAGKFDYEQQ